MNLLSVSLGATPRLPLSASFEEPGFKTVSREGPVEIRQYESFLVAEVVMQGDFEKVGNRAHDPLFDYISGKNTSQEEVEMAVPVNQSKDGEEIEMAVPVNQSRAQDGTYRVSFVLPSRFTLATAPRPVDERVQIREVAARKMAVIRYSGTWSRENYLANEKILFESIREQGLRPVGEPTWARYNPPWKLWFLRRNEIMVEVRQSN